MWNVIYTKSRKEKLALENLERQGFSCYLPLLKREAVVRGKTVVKEEALFARYLFLAEPDPQQGLGLAPIRSTVGVSQLLQFAGKPAQVTDEWIIGLQQSLAESQNQPQQLFAEGEKLRVTAGPFSGYEVFYTCHDGEQRAQVLIEMLGKMQKVSIPIQQLQSL